jgi:SAM-dependent methyltransferase
VTGVTRPRSLGYSGRTGSNPADSRTTFESLNSLIRSAVDPTTWIELSFSAMKKSAPSHRAAVQAVAEAFPFANDAFEAAMAVLTLHHWSHPVRGLAELRRVASNRAVVLSIAPDHARSFWLTARYFPAIGAWDAEHFLPMT